MHGLSLKIVPPLRQSNPKLRDYVHKKLGGNFRKLEALYFKRLLQIIESYPTNNGYIGERERERVIHTWAKDF